ncbi:MAG TPA: hypothetical protein VL549_01440 [Gemmatimonadales bacterium]|nr:hypothetical protein [Gemmatimonadales bacterium]
MTEPGPGSRGPRWALVALAWLLVGIPLAWGIYRTLRSAVVLFR